MEESYGTYVDDEHVDNHDYDDDTDNDNDHKNDSYTAAGASPLVLAPWSKLLGPSSLLQAPCSRRLGSGSLGRLLGSGSLVRARFLTVPPLYLVPAASCRAGS